MKNSETVFWCDVGEGRQSYEHSVVEHEEHCDSDHSSESPSCLSLSCSSFSCTVQIVVAIYNAVTLNANVELYF